MTRAARQAGRGGRWGAAGAPAEACQATLWFNQMTRSGGRNVHLPAAWAASLPSLPVPCSLPGGLMQLHVVHAPILATQYEPSPLPKPAGTTSSRTTLTRSCSCCARWAPARHLARRCAPTRAARCTAALLGSYAVQVLPQPHAGMPLGSQAAVHWLRRLQAGCCASTAAQRPPAAAGLHQPGATVAPAHARGGRHGL